MTRQQSMDTFERRWKWQEKFRGHYVEIARKVRVADVSLTEEDFQRNTDFILQAVVNLPHRQLRVSARARQHDYKRRFQSEFTVRYPLEMRKLLHGYGDVFIYGFEAAPGADRLHPWIVANSEMLRQYIRDGGYYEIRPNRDRRSNLAAFDLFDMPLGFLFDSDGHIPVDYKSGWGRCRNSYDPDVQRGGEYSLSGMQRFGMCNGNYAAPLAGPTPTGAKPRFETGMWRYCMCCGFEWKSGWVMDAESPTGSNMLPLLAPSDIEGNAYL